MTVKVVPASCEVIHLNDEPIQIAIDRAECIGSGQCVVVAPRAFVLDNAMKAAVLDPSAESLDAILEAAEICPTQAIYVSQGKDALFP
jgi:ferredoxin